MFLFPYDSFFHSRWRCAKLVWKVKGPVTSSRRTLKTKNTWANWAMNQKRAPWLFRVCRGWTTTQLWFGLELDHYNDPYCINNQYFCFPKVRPFFLWLNLVFWGSWLIRLDLFKRQICSMALYISAFVSTSMIEKKHLCDVMICVLSQQLGEDFCMKFVHILPWKLTYLLWKLMVGVDASFPFNMVPFQERTSRKSMNKSFICPRQSIYGSFTYMATWTSKNDLVNIPYMDF